MTLTTPIALRLYQTDRQEYPVNLYLPELCADQELRVNGVDTHTVVQLLQSLVKQSEPEQSIDVALMTASDRDRLLVRLYQEYWGDQVVSTLYCDQCTEPFDLSFNLSELQQSLFDKTDQWEVSGNARLTANHQTEEPERELKAPVFAQEKLAVNRSVDDATDRLTRALDIKPEAFADICRQLEQAAPIMDVELEADCPECQRHHLAHFDIQTYLLQRLINERNQILSEVHLIASSYGWSLAEIKGLPRNTRNAMARLIVDTN